MSEDEIRDTQHEIRNTEHVLRVSCCVLRDACCVFRVPCCVSCVMRMREEVVRQLNALNRRFYEAVARPFAAS